MLLPVGSLRFRVSGKHRGTATIGGGDKLHEDTWLQLDLAFASILNFNNRQNGDCSTITAPPV